MSLASPLALWLKSALERPLALALLVVLAPLLALIALLIKVTSPGPVIFERLVTGHGGRRFYAHKFRTMVVEAERLLEERPELKASFLVNHKLRDDPRVTPVGRLLRKLSLDELPQLVNVVKGEMWLIGPRMVSPGELAKYGEHAAKLISVRPGITGLWQVSGRQTTSYEERVQLDIFYIENWTPWLDLTILLRTPIAVVTTKGAY